jgi:hypothetical protein
MFIAVIVLALVTGFVALRGLWRSVRPVPHDDQDLRNSP